MESIGQKLVGMFESIKQFMIKQDKINHGFDERLKDLEKDFNFGNFTILKVKIMNLENEMIDVKQALYRIQKEDVKDNN